MTAATSGLCAFIDAPAGCAGDMFLGALVDLGLDPAVLSELATRMGLDDVQIHVAATTRMSLAATKVDVVIDDRAMTPEHDHTHVHLPTTSSGHHPDGHTTLAQVQARIARLGDLSVRPWSDAIAVFRALAEAEALVHGTTPDKVHFHEVGAADALVDIVGTCVGLHTLGVERVYVGPLPWGSGTIRCAHGEMPNPAPATVHLLKGHPVRPSDATYEQVTPTGAALVRVFSRGTQVPDGFCPQQTGMGAGTHDADQLANVVRITLGTMSPETMSPETMSPETGSAEAGSSRAERSEVGADEVVCLLETNIDDASGQVVGRAAQRLLAEGALDVWHTAVAMKKDRPGTVLSVLCHPSQRSALTQVLFRETPTLGVRTQELTRAILARHDETVTTPWGDVRVKVRQGPDGPEATPEYEDCCRLADEHDVPVRRVLDAALRGWSA